MKYKRTILLLSAFIMLCVYIILPLMEEKLTKDGFKDEIIRLHIRANSDKKEDQELKLKIRDEILEVMKDKFKETKSLEESRIVIRENMDMMKDMALKVIKEVGADYTVDIALKEDNFPIRRYGNMIFPQGKYEALLIEIGEAKGQNWWCVMFPPLCFVDITQSLAYMPNNELGNFIEEEDPPLKLKSKIGEFFKKRSGKHSEQLTVNSEQRTVFKELGTLLSE